MAYPEQYPNEKPVTWEDVQKQMHERLGSREVEFVERINASLDRATAEIARLQQVIADQAKTLSVPLADNVSLSLHSFESPEGRHVRYRMTPQLGEIRVPIDARAWSRDHRDVFVDQIANEIGNKAARLMARDLWPHT